MNALIKALAAILFLSMWLTLNAQPVRLVAKAKTDSPHLKELSGIAKSRNFEGVYWAHNDSGDWARVFAFDESGKTIDSEVKKYPEKGINLPGVMSEDWEDITIDDEGNLYIGDFGNNLNTRRNLVIHVFPEPDPRNSKSAKRMNSIRFAYPDQKDFPPRKREFDCEAMFWADGKLHLLSKNLGDTFTKLYRFDSINYRKINRPTLVSRYETGQQVTGAEASPDGRRIAVMATRSVWIFEKPEDSNDFLAGPVYRLSVQAGQCEAICWKDPETLLIASEYGDLYELPAAKLKRWE